jgi:hypothetical protein
MTPTPGNMDFQPDLTHADPSCLLVAAEPGIGPHRLVTLCCTLARGDAPSVTLLIPEGEVRAGDQLVGRGAVLLQAAGLRLEDVIERHLNVLGADRPAAWHVNWLRRLVGPAAPWPRPREAAR